MNYTSYFSVLVRICKIIDLILDTYIIGLFISRCNIGLIFSQNVKCRRVKEICLHARDSKNPAGSLGPTAVSSTSLAQGPKLMAMSPARPY